MESFLTHYESLIINPLTLKRLNHHKYRVTSCSTIEKYIYRYRANYRESHIYLRVLTLKSWKKLKKKIKVNQLKPLSEFIAVIKAQTWLGKYLCRETAGQTESRSY